MSIVNQTIDKLQKDLNLHYSKEQLAVLQHNITTPQLINACAGSGKTMLLISLMLLRIKSNQNQPHDLLGITFSHVASLDMRNRFLKDSGNMKQAPYFATFHALFFRLLNATKVLKNVSVLTSYGSIYMTLVKHIVLKPKYITDAQLMQKIFRARDQVINSGYTYNGLNLAPHANLKEIREGAKIPKLIFGYQKPDIHTSYYDTDKCFIKNYQSLVSAYNQYKQQHNMIDFSDMLTVLWKYLHVASFKTKVQKLMSQFKLVFMDEFQDISTLQWKIMTNILSKEALQHITLIGDDDQSIYSFRGSNPSIILNLHKNYPNLHTFNLSTNYRTGGNILKAVRPLITSNHYRLPKHLETANKGIGHLIEFFSNDRRYSANDILLQDLLFKIKDPNTPNNQIAILMHFNSSRMLLYDWLANHNVYLSNKTPYLLQNDKWFQTALNIIKGLITNDMKYIYNASYYIGYRKYKKHLNKFMKSSKYKNKVQTVTGYIKQDYQSIQTISMLGITDHNIVWWIALDAFYIQNYLHHDDSKIQKFNQFLKTHVKDHWLLNIINHAKAYRKKSLGELLWYCVDRTTFHHDSWLLSNYLIGHDKYKQIKTYLKQQFLRINNYQDYQKFLKESKNRQTGHKINCKGIHIMSLHQSKGLQFKYVYLYDLSSRIDNQKSIVLNYVFPPNISVFDFIRYEIQTPLKQIIQLEKVIYKVSDNKQEANKSKHGHYKHAFAKLHIKITDYLNKKELNEAQMMSKILHLTFNKNKMQSAIQEQVWQIYHDVIHISQAVEEQRRLIYVGCTRAEQDLYLAYNKDADPLLNELAIPKNCKFYLEPNHKVYDYLKNQKYMNRLKSIK